MVKNPPAMRETRVQSLGSEDLLEEGMATHSTKIDYVFICEEIRTYGLTWFAHSHNGKEYLKSRLSQKSNHYNDALNRSIL